MENIYEIKNLVCSYNGAKDVLKVEHLEIPRGKIVVLLGVSGAGKSTILETLGLMNNTIKNGSSVLFLPNHNETVYDFGKLWENKNRSKISEIRKKHFSFIFQNTNFMPNFTAYENISITKMIENTSKEEAMKKTEEIAESLGLYIDKNKKVFEMSGGEKQRAAFIRAILSEFTILFGDEPTGNLDPINAVSLLKLMKNTIKNKNKTAIIVSHNIHLALEFADIIIVLKKIKDKYSVISEENIFTKEEKEKIEWLNFKGEIITNNISKIIQSLITDNNQK